MKRLSSRAFVNAFIAVAALGSAALILARLPTLRSRSRLESVVSREAAFLYNNLLLVAFALRTIEARG